MINYNINTTNVITTSFTTTKQNITYVHESNITQLHIQTIKKKLYTSIILPTLIINTVDNNTTLPQQQQILKIINCTNPKKISHLTKIITNFYLTLNISTLNTMSTKQFTSTHKHLKQNKPIQ